MKLKRKKRIIISNKTTNIGLIFISNKYNPLSKKKININKTNLHYNTNSIQLFEPQNINTILTSLNICPKEIINIYKNILYIIVVDNLSELDNFKKHTFIDLYIKKTDSIYNDIYNYNKFDKNNYLNTIIKDDKNIYSLKLIDLYYYMIGYI